VSSKGLLGLLVVGMLAQPISAAAAQQANKIWRLGLSHVGLDHVPPSLPTLRQELKNLGYVEGKNLSLDWRNLPDEESANKTAKEFVQSHVDLIVAFESQTARAARAATSDIPIVVVHVADPVAEGFGKTMSRPGGNMTGFYGVGDLPGKRLQLFKEVVPKLRRAAILVDPRDPGSARYMDDLRQAAKGLKIQLVEREVETEDDVTNFYRGLTNVEGILAASQTLNVKFPSLMIRLAAEKRLPFAGYRREWVEQGALFSYAHDLASVGPLAAHYVDRIFKGAKPAELPFQEPSKFEFVVNLKTAKALGLTVPPNVLARADRVIK
jgi:putative tryptophan/tyrosine transport system substrate-binding protein